MRRTIVLSITFVAAFAGIAGAAYSACNIVAPHWGGKGAEGTVTCYLWIIPVYGWFSKSECEENPLTRGTYGAPPRWAHPIFGKLQSKGAQRFSNATQSIECSGAASSGGFYKPTSEEQEGLGPEEFVFTGCKVWKGAFSSELKECHVTSLEGGQNTNLSGVINFEANTELVYLNKEGTKIGDLLSGNGKELAELDFTGTGCIKSNEQELTGEVLAELTPQNEEVKSMTMIFPTTAKSTCWKWSSPGTLKACAAVELSAYGEATTVSGEDTEELTSKEAFGVFD